VQLLLCGMFGSVGMRRRYGSCSGAAYVAWAEHGCAILLDGFRAAAMLMLHCALDMLPCIFGTSAASPASAVFVRQVVSSSSWQRYVLLLLQLLTNLFVLLVLQLIIYAT
jgi:hypothetical protein